MGQHWWHHFQAFIHSCWHYNSTWNTYLAFLRGHPLRTSTSLQLDPATPAPPRTPFVPPLPPLFWVFSKFFGHNSSLGLDRDQVFLWGPPLRTSASLQLEPPPLPPPHHWIPFAPPFLSFLAITPVWDLIENWGFREDLPQNPHIPPARPPPQSPKNKHIASAPTPLDPPCPPRFCVFWP